MPKNLKLMSNLVKEYGEKKAENIYYAIENKQKQESKTVKPAKKPTKKSK